MFGDFMFRGRGQKHKIGKGSLDADSDCVHERNSKSSVKGLLA